MSDSRGRDSGVKSYDGKGYEGATILITGASRGIGWEMVAPS